MKLRFRWCAPRLAALLLLASAAACNDQPGLPEQSDPITPAGAPAFALSGPCVILSNTSTYGTVGFTQLNDFGRILADADNPSCAANAASTLRDKLANTRANDYDWFGDEWIDGNYVAMVLAAADRIGQHGHMTAALDAELQWVANTFKYVEEPLNGCGLHQTDNCLDGYSAAAAGFAWIAAYRFRHNDPSGAAAARSKAQVYIDSSFASVCIRQLSTGVGPLCDGTPGMIPAGTAHTYSWNEGQQFPAYGFGLMTSIAAAVLGWEGSVSSGQYLFSQANRDVARGLFEETRRVVDATPSPDMFLRRCIRPAWVSGGWSLTADSTADCAGLDFPGAVKYQPEMYALRTFYSARLGYIPPAGGYQSSTFNPGHFDLSSSELAREGWFGWGRYVFYGDLGYQWWRVRRGYMPMDAYQPKGYLDRIDGARMAHGWACDPDVPSKAVKVELRVAGYVVTGVANQPSETAVYNECGGGTAHRFSIQLPSGTVGYSVSARALDYTFGFTDLVCLQSPCVVPPTPTVEVVWVQPAEASWGQPNTLTAAGNAAGGTGGVKVEWRDVTFASNPAWSVATNDAPVNPASNSWSATIPTPYDCHTIEVRATYFGVMTPVFRYNGRTAGFCAETARMIWIQPSSTAGFGPPGSLVVAGEAKGAPPGTTVSMYYRNVTLGASTFTRKNYDAPTDQNGIWFNDIPNANPYHQYEVYATYDVITTSRCTYAGTNSNTWC